jgi:hypothetical protein
MVRAATRSAETLEARAPMLPSGKFSDNTVKLMLRVRGGARDPTTALLG